MTEFAARQVQVYDLPLPKGVKLLQLEKVVLVYHKSHSIDFGALCYLRRSDSKRLRGKGRRVDLSSFSETRSLEIRALVDHVSENFAYSGLRPNTLYVHHASLVRFMDWCDSNQHNDATTNESSARAAFHGYVDDLRRLVSQNQLGSNTAASYQDDVLSVLQDYLNVENLDRGINRLMKSERLVEPTLVPDDASQEKVLAWCKCLFSGLSELLIDQRPYPFPLTVPGYLNWPDSRLWVFPVSHWVQTPDDKTKKEYRAYDFLNGRIRTPEEIEQLYGKTPLPAHKQVRNAQKAITTSNQDFFSRARIDRGNLAARAFLMMYIACTGNNPAQAVETPWSEELEAAALNPLVERRNFRTIKYRANNRPVTFEIGVEYMPYLRRYLQLRKYLLNGRRCDYLFFGYGPNNSEQVTGPTLLPAATSQTTYVALRRLTPTLPRVVPRQWRAAKQDHVIRNYELAMAARAMQHSQATAAKKYSNGSEVTQQIELSAFFSQVEKVVLKQGQEIAGSEIRSVGICTFPKHPQAIVDHLPVIPDCKGAEGCLFCDKYRIHADETDARKLLSARYCIKKTSHLASSPEQFRRLFGCVLQRINFILNEVKRRDVKMMEKVEREVDIEGELDPFWSAKLEMLMELELI